ncbi:MAG: hypothetical protein P4L84_14775 [Isosphaeraceae bacterium]|nr:hypothetical protein [Isosphaeraceae bacterium]
MSDGVAHDRDGRFPGRRARLDPVQWVAALCVAVLAVVCFHPVLFGGEQFGFRDAGDFYYPLYQRVQQEWDAGRIPLWEPEENGGTPLLANPTAAVFYPGKLVYAVLPYAWATRAYVIAHVLLAAAAQYAFLRSLAVSPAGAALGGLSYGFGAPVLALTCNVVFLVGAAWMPLGFLAAEVAIRTRKRSACAGLAVVLALLVLGGDPEAAYLIALAAVGYALWLCGGEQGPGWRQVAVWLLGLMLLGAVFFGLAWSDARGEASGRFPTLKAGRALFWVLLGAVLVVRAWRNRRSLGLEMRWLALASACALALLLAGVQIVPSLEFIARSTRSTGAGPDDIYRFSLAPIETFGFLWPNFVGTFGGANAYWLPVLPPKHQWCGWFPSLYCGAPVLILALAAAGARKGPAWRGWLTGVAVVGLLASLGEYGSPLLWLRWVAGPESFLGPVGLDPGVSRSPLADGVGGVYWLFGVLAPGFHSFRYPAKLLMPACVAISALAGYGWDELLSGRRSSSLRVSALAVLLGALGLGLAVGNQRALIAALRRTAFEAMTAYGPLDATGAGAAIIVALVHGTVAGLALWALVRRAGRASALRASTLLIVLTLDLALANRWVVMTVPQAIFDAQPRLVGSIRQAEQARSGPTPFRIHRMLWSPTAWNLTPSENRPATIVAWEHDTLRPKYGIPHGLSYTYSVGTAELVDAAELFTPTRRRLGEQAARAYDLKANQPFVYHCRRAFDMWNTRYIIVPGRLALNSLHRGILAFLPHVQEIDPPPGTIDEARDPERAQRWLLEDDVRVLLNEDAYPRAWVVHRARVRPPGRDSRARRDALEEIRYPADEFWFEPAKTVYDPHHVAWVETDEPAVVQRSLSQADPDDSERVAFVRYGPQEVEMAVTLRSSGLVILADTDYPGWRLEIDGKPAPILRTNLAMRGALVGKGAHRLVYRYVPGSFHVGGALSLLGLAALAWTAWPALRRACAKPVANLTTSTDDGSGTDIGGVA